MIEYKGAVVHNAPFDPSSAYYMIMMDLKKQQEVQNMKSMKTEEHSEAVKKLVEDAAKEGKVVYMDTDSVVVEK